MLLSEESPWSTLTDNDKTETDQLQTAGVITLKKDKAIQSSPRFNYYFCTPASQNMREELVPPSFLPHADAPKFEIKKCLESEDLRTSWQNLSDPDRL